MPARPIDTVFFGGGTPTLLPASDLASVLGRIKENFSLAQARRSPPRRTRIR